MQTGLYDPCPVCNNTGTRRDSPGLDSIGPCGCPAGVKYRTPLQQQQERERRQMREFETGATRDLDDDKPDYEGYFSPLVFRRYGEYMTKHRKQADGKMRDSDNWQKGIPITAYMKSLWRHLIELWTIHRRISIGGRKEIRDFPREEALCAVIFNASGYLHELLGDTEAAFKHTILGDPEAKKEQPQIAVPLEMDTPPFEAIRPQATEPIGEMITPRDPKLDNPPEKIHRMPEDGMFPLHRNAQGGSFGVPRVGSQNTNVDAI